MIQITPVENGFVVNRIPPDGNHCSSKTFVATNPHDLSKIIIDWAVSVEKVSSNPQANSD